MDRKVAVYGKAIISIILIYIMVYVGWSIYEHNTLRRPLQEISEGNKEFQGVAANARYNGLLDRSILIFNLKKIDKPEKISPFILFLDYANKLNNRNFNEVILQYKGKSKFKMSGVNFTQAGTRAQMEKPEQLALLFPSLLSKMNGLPAFEEPHGDEQWVIQKQMKNFREFLFEWYLDDWVKEQGKKGKDGEIPKPSPSSLNSEKKKEPENRATPESSPDGLPPIEPEEI